MAGLDKKAFITGPCLWLKVLQDTIYSLGVFSSWSSPPPPPLPHQKVGECSRTRVPVAATCSFHTSWGWPPGTAPQHCLWHKWDVRASASEESHYLWPTLQPTRSGKRPSAAEYPYCCPRSPSSPEICRRQSVGRGPPPSSSDFLSNCSCHSLHLL